MSGPETLIVLAVLAVIGIALYLTILAIMRITQADKPDSTKVLWIAFVLLVPFGPIIYLLAIHNKQQAGIPGPTRL